MSTGLLAARMDELNHVAEHVPAEVLARRITQIVEEYLSAHGYAVIMDSLAECFGVDTEARFAHDHPDPDPPSKRFLSEGPSFDSSVHVEWGRAADALMDAEEAWAFEILAKEELGGRWIEVPVERQSDLEPGRYDVPVSEPSEEPEKPCNTCGKTKALSEFPKNHTYKDGHTNKCHGCTRGYQRELKERKARKERQETEISDVTPITKHRADIGADERLCANGERCTAYDEDDPKPQPAILDEANPGPLCRRCQKRAGVA